MKIAKVTWLDAKSIIGDNYNDDEIKKEELLEIETVGFLLDSDAKKVILCSFKNKNEPTYRYVHFIPRCLIKKIEVK